MLRSLLTIVLLLRSTLCTFYYPDIGRQWDYESERQRAERSDYADHLAEIVEELGHVQREPNVREMYNDQIRGFGGNRRAEKFENADLARLYDQPKTKKGQNEFVEFIEPKAAKQLKHSEIIEKRVEASEVVRKKIAPIVRGSDFVFIAVGTVAVIAAVVGVTGGGLYLRRLKARNNATERSDFTHYAPTGPGRDKKKKKGDETLAYKAQLHHYQQTKQKIISGEEQLADMGDNETSDASDDEDGINNFSVYECPGLAPTGDIEVQNPNFDSRT
ncbi:hypothetical protein AB6A40_000623 [Gnathostoma spinigerum]|uniref:Uncharacterized protein n=1 Tax=Gnathostoma spinigerum TaxID=75299 RepID=A0ABD6E6X9_9BILA